MRMPYPHSDWVPYNHTFDAPWRHLQDVVVWMRELKDPEVYLEYQASFYGPEDWHSLDAEGLLKPLLNIRVLERFELRYGLFSHGNDCYEAQENNFLQELQETVARLRSPTGSPLGLPLEITSISAYAKVLLQRIGFSRTNFAGVQAD